MKRNKKLLILLGVLIAAIIATVIVSTTEKKKEEIKNADETIISIDTDTVSKLSWNYDETSLSFHKDDKWYYDEDDSFPVDDDKISDLLSLFEDFKSAFKIENVEDYSQYGLSNPDYVIEFSTDDKDYKVELGDYSTMDSERYISIGDGNVYLASIDPSDTFSIELKDTIKNDEIPDLSDVRQLTFSGNENYTAAKNEDSTDSYCADDIYYTKMNGKNLPLDTDAVNDYISTISNLSLDTYVTYNVTDEELKTYGLDSPALTVKLNYTIKDEDDNETSDVFTISIAQNPEELAAKQAAEDKDEEYDGTVTSYVRIGDSKIIYEISEDTYNALAAGSYNDLRHKDLMTADFDTVNMIDISLDGKKYTITTQTDDKSKDDDEDIKYLYNDEEIEITDLRSKIENLEISTFDNSQSKGKEEISLTLYLNDENHPQLTMSFYRYDGDNCIAVVNNEQIGLISRSQVVDLIEAVNSIIL